MVELKFHNFDIVVFMYTLQNTDIARSYNKSITGGKYVNDYEFNRWFIRARNRAEYAMTYSSIKQHVANISFKRCLELGPGPGTWTRLVYRANPAAQFDLVDISEAMKEQFELEMRSLPNVNYHVSDIMQYQTAQTYDLFFSSRAVEYFDDKPAFFKKLATLIAPQGAGVIVTKNPYHGIRKDTGAAHQGQIPMPEMKRMLEANGFIDVQFYPVVIRLPIVSRFTSEPAEYLFERRINQPLDINATNRTVESYLVKFKKA